METNLEFRSGVGNSVLIREKQLIKGFSDPWKEKEEYFPFPVKAADKTRNVGLPDGGAGARAGGLTQVVGAGSPLGDVNKCSPRRDVQDLVVTVGNGDILEASRHLSAGGFSPAANPASVDHGAGAQNAIAALGLAGGRGGDDAREGRFIGGQRDKQRGQWEKCFRWLSDTSLRGVPAPGGAPNPLKSHTC